MATDLTTTNVVDTKSGTGWTIDVTACNLLSDLSVKDFVMLIAGSVEPNSNITKTSQTVLTYGGASIGSSTIEVRRVTPQNRFQEITFAEKFSSTVYNEEIDRAIRRAYEYTLNGIGPGSTATSVAPLNQAYSAAWSTDTIVSRTANQLYTEFEKRATLSENEAITGTWTATTQTDTDNSTKLATTAYADTRVTNALATSPTLGGNPTTTTQSDNDNSTKIATTAYADTRVSNSLSSSPALGGTPTAPTASDATDSTQVATTAFVKNVLEAFVYPVGSIYINATNATNPGTLLGFGTWVVFGAGRVLVSLNSGDTDFDTSEETGGSKTHTLTESEIPSHTHQLNMDGGVFASGASATGSARAGASTAADFTNATGGGGAHNNVQPYIVVYMWKRTV